MFSVAYLICLQMSDESALSIGGYQNGKKMPAGVRSRGATKAMNARVANAIEISPRDLAAAGGPAFELRKVDIVEQRRLEFVETAVVADFRVFVFGGLTVVAHDSDGLVQARIVGEDRAAVAHRGEVLGGVKTCCRQFPGGPGGLAVERRQDGLCAVFDDIDLEGAEAIQVERISVKVNGEKK